MATLAETFARLERSTFRSRFHLGAKEKAYVQAKGLETIRRHAEDFITQRLAPSEISNDGRQTPMRGHPVFIAQHACACCCRGCLEKWYHIPRHRPLTQNEITRIINLLMAWIEKETGFNLLAPGAGCVKL